MNNGDRINVRCLIPRLKDRIGLRQRNVVSDYGYGKSHCVKWILNVKSKIPFQFLDICFKFITLESLISIGLRLLISEVFSRAYVLIWDGYAY